jgi:cell division septation protein DedD
MTSVLDNIQFSDEEDALPSQKKILDQMAKNDEIDAQNESEMQSMINERRVHSERLESDAEYRENFVKQEELNRKIARAKEIAENLKKPEKPEKKPEKDEASEQEDEFSEVDDIFDIDDKEDLDDVLLSKSDEQSGKIVINHVDQIVIHFH